MLAELCDPVGKDVANAVGILEIDGEYALGAAAGEDALGAAAGALEVEVETADVEVTHEAIL